MRTKQDETNKEAETKRLRRNSVHPTTLKERKAAQLRSYQIQSHMDQGLGRQKRYGRQKAKADRASQYN